MFKVLKRLFIIVLVAMAGLILTGCKEDDKPEGNEPQANQVAHLDANLQGTYYGEDVEVVISESKVKITDPSGKELEYTIYVDEDGKYYILEEERKVYCTFGEDSVTNEKGTFTKEQTPPTPPAKEKVAITFEVTIPDLAKGNYEFVIKGSFSSWNCSEEYKLEKDGDIYKITIEFEEGSQIEYKYAIMDSENPKGVVEVMADGKDIANRKFTADEAKTITDTIERFKGIKLASEVEQIKELVDNTFYDNDRGAVHQISFDDDGYMNVTYSKGAGKAWSCIIRPFTAEESGLLDTIKFTFIGEKDVEYLFKVEGGDANQEEGVVGTGEIQEYTMKIGESSRNSARLVIFGHKGQAGTDASPITGSFKVISIKATLKEPEPEVEREPGENPIHILAIGNSFSDDGLWLLYNILEQMGYDDIIVANLYIGGCSVATHKSNLTNDAAAYTYRINKDGTWVNKNGYKASTALEERRWDYISLQQASDYSGLVSSYVEADIDFIYQYAYDIASIKNPDVKMVWHMTWAYQQNSNHSAFPNYNKDQMTMYNGIINAVTSVIVNDKFNPIIVPSGTTIQNLRTTFLGDTITRDGYHLNEAYGRYSAALTWAIALTGKDISEIVRPSSVSAKYDPLCKEAASNANSHPFEVTESQFKEEPTGEEVDLSGYELLDSSTYIIGNGYYNSGDGTKFLTPIQDGSTFCNGYITTKLFTKDELPIGTIIMIGSGYQYRPEGWIDEAKQQNRNPNTTEAMVTVDEAWWSNYIYRAFNISKVAGGVLTGEEYDKAVASFKIYIPKQ